MLFQDPEGNYPKYLGDIRTIDPEWQEGDKLPEGWQQITEAPYPTDIPDEHLVEWGELENKDGKLVIPWVIRPWTDEERARITAPERAKQRLIDLGFDEYEIKALIQGLVG